jgi:outer membrane lipoprotein SlyB
LKTHKGWKNVLNTTGKGAAAGSTIGSAIMPGIGTAIGAAAGAIIGGAAAGIGEWFGAKKRKRKAEELAERKKEADYAIAYHNSRQAEQLESANDNAAKAQADLNRRNVLALAAYGGKLKRRNYLI